jgi:hypothetical protein
MGTYYKQTVRDVSGRTPVSNNNYNCITYATNPQTFCNNPMLLTLQQQELVTMVQLSTAGLPLGDNSTGIGNILCFRLMDVRVEEPCNSNNNYNCITYATSPQTFCSNIIQQLLILQQQELVYNGIMFQQRSLTLEQQHWYQEHIM